MFHLLHPIANLLATFAPVDADKVRISLQLVHPKTGVIENEHAISIWPASEARTLWSDWLKSGCIRVRN